MQQASETAAIKSAGIPGIPGSPSPVKKPASISNYLIKGAQLTQFTDLMAKWVYRVKRGNAVELQVQVASATQRRNFWASKASGMFPLMEQQR